MNSEKLERGFLKRVKMELEDICLEQQEKALKKSLLQEMKEFETNKDKGVFWDKIQFALERFFEISVGELSEYEYNEIACQDVAELYLLLEIVNKKKKKAEKEKLLSNERANEYE
jgi:hypothetical protein